MKFIFQIKIHVFLIKNSIFALFMLKTIECGQLPQTIKDLLKVTLYITKRGLQGIPVFLIFAPKYRLWVLVRTASLMRF